MLCVYGDWKSCSDFISSSPSVGSAELKAYSCCFIEWNRSEDFYIKKQRQISRYTFFFPKSIHFDFNLFDFSTESLNIFSSQVGLNHCSIALQGTQRPLFVLSLTLLMTQPWNIIGGTQVALMSVVSIGIYSLIGMLYPNGNVNGTR